MRLYEMKTNKQNKTKPNYLRAVNQSELVAKSMKNKIKLNLQQT